LQNKFKVISSKIEYKSESAYKPGSVEDNYSSTTFVTVGF